MKKKTKKILLIVACIVLLILLFFAYQVYTAVMWFKIEEGIYHRYDPVVLALHDYEKEHGTAPYSLRALIPKYIKSFPPKDDSEVLHYRSADTEDFSWELIIESKKRGDHLNYVVRSKNSYSYEERKRIRKIFHGHWAVMETSE